jgi:peroxiredoxin
MTLRVGDPAPDFAVGERTLHQMLGERGVILFFFPKAFTAG